MTNADFCRDNGWGPGTVLEGDEGYGPERILITAVGREQILTVCVKSTNGFRPQPVCEYGWTLEFRSWKRV